MPCASYSVTVTCSCPRMGLVVNLLQSLDAGVGVDLRGTERGMPQQLLNGAQVGSGIEHVGCEGVTERVDPETVSPDPVEHPVHHALNAARPQPLPPPTHEHGAAVCSGPGDHR